jgi:hypothetical protein
MLKYFDKTFFKFFSGFVAIVLVSLILTAVASYLDSKERGEPACVAGQGTNC